MEAENGQKAIKRQENIIIMLCWAVYTIAYLGRYSYNANISLIMNDFGVTHASAGLVTTCFFFAYGIGQVVNGFMCRRYNKKLLFPLVLVLSSVLNLLAARLPFSYIKYAWLLNGFLQSCLWSSIINILSTNISANSLNRALMIMGTSTTVGTVVIYAASALFARLENFRLSFVFAAVMMVAVAVMWILLFRPVAVFERAEEKKVSSPGGSFKGLWALLAVLAIFAVMNNFIKDGLSTWVPAILKENYNMPDSLSILLTLVLPVLGIFGAAVSIKGNGIIRDFVSLSAVFFLISAAFISVITGFPSSGAFVMLLCFGLVLCFMHGVNNIITCISPLKLRDSVDSGRMAGVLNGFCYLGSTISSYGLGAVADMGGWTAVFILLLSTCIAGVVIGGVYAAINRRRTV